MQILAVMVRYRMPLADSKTLRGLCTSFESNPDLTAFYKVMIWDNSPEALAPQEINAVQFPVQFLYRHSEANLGPAGAFNQAARYARENGHDWMLLLDQDMEIHADFLRILLHHRREVDNDSKIAAIAPTVRVNQFVVSPRRQLFNRHRPYPEKESGIAPGEARVINSGCLMRVAALEKIGGFSANFWLDYSDLYVFHQFFLHGLKVWRAADAELQHEMTVMDYDLLMSPWRFRNLSQAETAFNDLYLGRLENAAQTIRLFARVLKLRVKYDNLEFARIAWQEWIYRTTTTRSIRLAKWRAEGLKQRARMIHEANTSNGDRETHGYSSAEQSK